MTWPPLEDTEAANDPTEEDLIDYKIPDVVTRRAPIPPTPVAAFPAQAEIHIQPNDPNAEQLAFANEKLNGLALEILEDSDHQVRSSVTEDPMALTKLQAQTAGEILAEPDYDKNLSRASERTKPGPRKPGDKSAAVTPDNLAEAKVAPTTKTVRPINSPIAGIATVKPGELKAKVEKQTFFKRLFG